MDTSPHPAPPRPQPTIIFAAAQLFRPALLAAGGADSPLDLPLPTIVDWPDCDERGVWNGLYEPEDWVAWMSALKLNYANQGSTPADFERGVRVTQTLENDIMHAAELKGFRYIPQIVSRSSPDPY